MICVPPAGSFSCKSSSLLYEKFCLKTRFETEAQGDKGMGYSFLTSSWHLSFGLLMLDRIKLSKPR